MVKIGANIDEFKKRMAAVQNDIAELSDNMQTAGQNLTAFFTVPLGLAGAASIKLASDMQESLNKVNVAFGDSAGDVVAWSNTTIEKMGLASGTALDAAALFGDMATSMGINRDEAAKMSMSMVQLGADLASFKNVPIEQAMQALNGVFTGETESLKMLGVVMTETQLQAFALTQGITKKVQKMSEAEMVALRYAFVMDRTKNAQGDFARTSEGSANQMRMFQENLKELGKSLGEVILPTFTKLVNNLNDLLKSFQELSPETKQLIVIVAGLAAALGPLLLIVGSIAPIITTASAIFTGLGAVLTGLGAGPIALIIAAIAGLVAAGIYLYKKWDEIKLGFSKIIGFIQRNFEMLLYMTNPIFIAIINGAKHIYQNWEFYSKKLEPLLNGVQFIFEKVFGAIKYVFMTGIKIADAFLQKIGEVFPSIGKVVDDAKGTFKEFEKELAQLRLIKSFEAMEEKTKQYAWTTDYLKNKTIDLSKANELALTPMNNLKNSLDQNEDSLKNAAKAFEALKKNTIESTNEVGKAIIDALRNRQKAQDEEIKTLESNIQKSNQLYEQHTKEIQTNFEKQIEAARNASEQIIDEINKRYAREQEMLMSNLDKEKKPYEERLNNIEDAFAREQEALDETTYEAERARIARQMIESSAADHRAKVTEELAKLMISREKKLLEQGKTLRIDNLMELTQEENDLIKQRLNEARKTEKESLKFRIEMIKQDYAMQAVIAEANRTSELAKEEQRIKEEEAKISAFFENWKKMREENYLSTIEYYKKEIGELRKNYIDYSNEVIAQNAAKKLLLANDHTETMKLLESYNPDWKAKGENFGQSLLAGLASKTNDINKAINNLLSKVNSISDKTAEAMKKAANVGANVVNKSMNTISATIAPPPPPAVTGLQSNLNVSVNLDGRNVASGIAPHFTNLIRSGTGAKV